MNLSTRGLPEGGPSPEAPLGRVKGHFGSHSDWVGSWMPNDLLYPDTHTERTVPHTVTLSLIKEARIYAGEKTASSISGAGKIGQVHVKV